MIQTKFTELFGIKHPVVLAGMSPGTSPELVAAVSNAGGLGILGVSEAPPEKLKALVASVREKTNGPFGLNLILSFMTDEEIDLVLEQGPAVLSTTWANDSQDLKSIFARAHQKGAKVLHMVPSVADAVQAADSGADAIVAQGTDGGGHIGLMGTAVIVPAVVTAVAPIPVLAAGGIADGRGLAAMLAFGAAGVLMGTRFLATAEAPLHEAFKQHIVDTDGTDTVVSDVGDVMLGNEWPGALGRTRRNRLIERWLGRPNDLRRRRQEIAARMLEARNRGDVDESIFYFGQSAALIGEVKRAAEVVSDTVAEAAAILVERLPSAVVREAPTR